MRSLVAIKAICVVMAWLWGADVLGEYAAEVVLPGLNLPFDVAIQPSTGHPFVAESGAGRIIRVVDGQAQTVIHGFPLVDVDGGRFQLGPVGIHFLNQQTLVVVGSGGRIGIYQVPEPEQDSIPADQTTIFSDAGTDLPAQIRRIAVTRAAIYSTSWRQDGQAAPIRYEMKNANSLGPPEWLSQAPAAGLLRTSTALTISPRGELVISTAGQFGSSENDSQLAFCRARDGSTLLQLDVRLRDLMGIAYGARQGLSNQSLLYGVDAAWSDVERAGLFRMDATYNDGQTVVRPVRIASFVHPTALALDQKSGSFYVTTVGDGADGSPSGQLLKLPPGL